MRRARREGVKADSVLSSDLDEVPAGVVEDCGCNGTHGCWGLHKAHASLEKSGVFGLYVVDGERRERNAIGDQAALNGPTAG